MSSVDRMMSGGFEANKGRLPMPITGSARIVSHLRSVNVHRGQKVSTRQSLGAVASDNILQFQLRKLQNRLNPEAWIGR